MIVTVAWPAKYFFALKFTESVKKEVANICYVKFCLCEKHSKIDRKRKKIFGREYSRVWEMQLLSQVKNLKC